MMKGKLKQLVSVLLISVLVLSMAAPGYAAGKYGNYTDGKEDANYNTLTITSKTSGHTFELYQIFGGEWDKDIKENELLTNIIWGDGINYTDTVQFKDTVTGSSLGSLKFVEALKKDSGTSDKFSSLTTTATSATQAVEVAAALSKIATQSDADQVTSDATAFANVANQFLIESKAIPQDTVEFDSKGKEIPTSDGTYVYTFSDLYDGYYLLKDQEDSLKGKTDQNGNTPTYTLYILRIVGGEAVEVEAKANTTTIDKYIVNPDYQKVEGEDELEKSEEYNIGDTIEHELDGSYVPDMTGYDRYWYIIEDTLCAGLDFGKILSVYVGDQEVTEEELEEGKEYPNYTYTTWTEGNDDENDEFTIYIRLNNFKESYSEQVGDEIVIRYTAKLNEYASIGSVGNDNTVKLYYSNNPYADYGGETTDLKKDGLGQTTEKKTIAYTTKLKIKKIDAQTKEPLKGAKFKITGKDTSQKYYSLITKAEYVYTYTEDGSGDYVKTSSDPDVFVEYDSTNSSHEGLDHYSRELSSEETNYYVTTEENKDDTEVEAVTGTSGYVSFTGLGEGTYLLEETEAPDGYTKLAKPIELKISFKDPTLESDQPDVNEDLGTWTYSYTVGEDTFEGTIEAENEEVVITLTNVSGAYMPSTGGVGTIVFTVVGLCAMAGAVIFLYTKKRREEL